jgi:3-oxoacyl-[acyl-carrier protein] reductase
VNAVNPGMVETEGVHAAGLDQSDFRKTGRGQDPARPHRQPRDVAPTVVFLASEDSGWMTGESLVIAAVCADRRARLEEDHAAADRVGGARSS